MPDCAANQHSVKSYCRKNRAKKAAAAPKVRRKKKMSRRRERRKLSHALKRDIRRVARLTGDY